MVQPIIESINQSIYIVDDTKLNWCGIVCERDNVPLMNPMKVKKRFIAVTIFQTKQKKNKKNRFT